MLAEAPLMLSRRELGIQWFIDRMGNHGGIGYAKPMPDFCFRVGQMLQNLTHHNEIGWGNANRSDFLVVQNHFGESFSRYGNGFFVAFDSCNDPPFFRKWPRNVGGSAAEFYNARSRT